MVRATVLAHYGALEEAAALEGLVTAERARVLGGQHPDTLRCRANQLLMLHQQGSTRAEGNRRQVIQDLAAMLGASHPDVITVTRDQRLLCMIDPQPF
jgi:hypothetical protein